MGGFVKQLDGTVQPRLYSNGGASGNPEKTVSIENVTGETAVIDQRKFTEYALNPERQPDKARAFKEALGYDMSNYQHLEKQIREHFDRNALVQSGENDYGKKYRQIMQIQGINGKTAKVLTAWIDDKIGFRMTSAYVDK